MIEPTEGGGKEHDAKVAAGGGGFTLWISCSCGWSEQIDPVAKLDELIAMCEAHDPYL